MGALKVSTCPRYEGSVTASWYPFMPVVNTISPSAVPGAATERHGSTMPSSRTMIAVLT